MPRTGCTALERLPEELPCLAGRRRPKGGGARWV